MCGLKYSTPWATEADRMRRLPVCDRSLMAGSVGLSCHWPQRASTILSSIMSLDAIFNPRSIAVVGATDSPVAAPGAPAVSFNAHTQIFLYTLIDWGYPGKIYPVNTKGDEIRGLKVYRSLRDIPGPVDYVICIIPADATPGLVQDCAAKGVKGLHLYTAGFAETGLADKSALQADLVRVARSGGVRMIGPNCMGIYCPKMGMTYGPNFPREPGNVAFISQSGSYTLLLVRAAAARGLRFSKVVSYGNASDLDEIDLLDYLADDPETEIIGAYLEGAKDGPGLAKVLTKAAAKKPTIIVKRGSTEAGKRGASTHTGALAGDDSVWDSMLKQAGAIRVEDFEEMADLMTTFAFFPLPRSRKAVAVWGGWWGRGAGVGRMRGRRSDPASNPGEAQGGTGTLPDNSGHHAQKSGGSGPLCARLDGHDAPAGQVGRCGHASVADRPGHRGSAERCHPAVHKRDEAPHASGRSTA